MSSDAHATDELLRTQYQELFLAHVAETGKRPNWPYKFLEGSPLEDANFYKTYRTITELEQEVWAGFFEETAATLYAEAIYEQYSVREKILAFYFTLIEVLKPYKGYVAQNFQGYFLKLLSHRFMKQFKEQFTEYSKNLLEEGQVREEIAGRMVLNSQYDKLLWVQLLFVLFYWVNDHSEAGEPTDAAIEKSVNLTFDLLARNAVDSGIDLAKFLLQKATQNEVSAE